MLGPLDEFPVHQIPQPIAWPASSDRNFYDRNYFNAHDRTGNIFLITGLGYYPNLGVKDAFVLVARRGEGDNGPHAGSHVAVNLSDTIDQDRLHPHVNEYRIEVIDPLRTVRVVLEETDGIAVDITWEGVCDAVLEQPHTLRRGARVTIDTCRFAQVGRWSGAIAIDGTDITVDPDTWVGTRDRSWGIRTSGEPEPAGAPFDPPFEGVWWTYVPMTFGDFSVIMIIQEHPDGYRIVNDCTRIWKDGRIEQLAWPHVDIHYRAGTRIPLGATIETTTRDRTPLRFDIDSKLAVPIHIGGGYAPNNDWLHGTWQGERFTRRVTYDLTDPAVVGMAPFGVNDHVGHAVCHEGDREPVEGWGLFEHGAFGRHDPSGFRDWMDVAPSRIGC